MSAAATNTPTNARTSAEPIGATGTTAARKVCGARSSAWASAESVARVGTPATVVVRSATSAESQIPPTVITASRTSACQWRRCAQPRNSGRRDRGHHHDEQPRPPREDAGQRERGRERQAGARDADCDR